MNDAPERIYILPKGPGLHSKVGAYMSERPERNGDKLVEYIHTDLMPVPYIKKIDELASEILDSTDDYNAVRLAHMVKQLFRMRLIHNREDNVENDDG